MLKHLSQTETQIRVVLADDHEVVRHGISIVLNQDAEIEVVGECSNGKEAIEMVAEQDPDVAVMDLSMPVMDGTTASNQIIKYHPKTKVLILSMHSELSRIKELTALGIMGFVTKSAAAEELIKAVKAVYAGQFYLEPQLAANAYSKLINAANQVAPLTERELDIVRLAAKGMSMKQAAELLFISPRTAQTHLYRAMKKLGMHSRHELVLFAIRENLIDIS